MRRAWSCMGIVALLLLCTLVGAESYDEMLAQTDRNNPDALYRLVVWCQENNFHSSANRHIREILAIDPNHAPTRELQGFIWDGRRWVHRSRMPGGGQQQDQQAGSGTARPAGPAPKAEDINWEMRVPRDPDTEGVLTNFLSNTIASMNRSRSGEWATLMLEGQRASGLSLLKAAIRDGTYTDLHGPLQITQKMLEDDEMSAARSMLPFLMHLSHRSNNAEDIALFAYVVSKFGDKRVVPRLIQLLDHPDEDVQFNTAFALGRFMHRGVNDIKKEEAQEWWARYHAAPDRVIYAASLQHRDPNVRLSAVQSITVSDWDDAIMPVLIGLVKEDDRALFMAASDQLRRITGSAWDLSLNSSREDRNLIAQRLESWWEDNRGRFRPVYMRQQRTTPEEQQGPAEDRYTVWVRDLSNIDSGVSSNAVNQLRNHQENSIPALIIEGLQSNDGIIRNRSRDLLREITGQNFGFEGMRGSDEERSQALDRWVNWAMENQHIEMTE